MKVQPFQILKPLYENLIVQEDRSSGFYNQLHQHSEIQLSLIVKGNGKLLVGDSIHAFTDGDFFAIGGHSPHLFKSERTSGDVHMISLFFTEATFGTGFFELSDLEEVRPFFKNSADGFRPMSKRRDVAQLMLQFPEASKLSRILLYLRLLRLLCELEIKPLTNFIYRKHTGFRTGARLQVVFDFVLHNFQRKLKLDTVADLVHMTPNAFCRFFKQRTNKTFFQFLIELRIAHAIQLLHEDNEFSIAEIAERSGFSSISNFNRKFLQLNGKKPSEIIKNKKTKKGVLT